MEEEGGTEVHPSGAVQTKSACAGEAPPPGEIGTGRPRESTKAGGERGAADGPAGADDVACLAPHPREKAAVRCRTTVTILRGFLPMLPSVPPAGRRLRSAGTVYHPPVARARGRPVDGGGGGWKFGRLKPFHLRARIESSGTPRSPTRTG